MNRQDIIDMAREAGFLPNSLTERSWLERFAALVAAKEREKAAQMCEFLAAETLKHTPSANPQIGIALLPVMAGMCTGCAEEIRLMGQS